MIKIEIPIAPVPASRVRVTRGGGRFYQEPYNSYRSELKKFLKDTAWKDLEPVQPGDLGYEVAKLLFIMPKPANPEYSYPVKGDTDNLEKALFDGMNDFVWKDDKHITKIKDLEKRFVRDGETPGTVIHFKARN